MIIRSLSKMLRHVIQLQKGLRFYSSWGPRSFSLSHARNKTIKHFSLFLYRAQKLIISLILLTNMTLSTLLILTVCFVIDLAHHRVSRAESEGLRFDFTWGLRSFSLSHARDETRKYLSLFLYRA